MTDSSNSARTGHSGRNSMTICQSIPAMVVELVSFIIVFVFSFLVAFNTFNIKPFQRGFFCDDPGLMYPYKEDTVSSAHTTAMSVAIFPLVVLIVEPIYIITRMRNMSIEQKAIYKTVGKSLYSLIIIHCLGGALTQTIVAMVKLCVGRLRPNFFATCIPEYNTTLCSVGGGYIEDFECTNADTDTVENSMQSFPSGHSSTVIYAFVYAAIYLDIRLRQQLKWRLYFRVVGPTLQTLLVTIALYICISRIQDNTHNPTDVLGGAAIGLVGSLITSLIWSGESLQELNVNTQQEPSMKASLISRPDGGSQRPIIQSTYSICTDGQDIPHFGGL